MQRQDQQPSHSSETHPEHVHDAACGHRSMPHEDHVDYLQDGHRHAEHGGHWDEHGEASRGGWREADVPR